MWCLFFAVLAIAGQLVWGLNHMTIGNKTVQDFTGEFKKIIDRAYAEKPYQTVYLQRQNPADCVNENIAQIFPVPVLIRTVFPYPINWKLTYNSEILVIMCLDKSNDFNSLVKLSFTLRYMRDVRIMIIINKDFYKLLDWMVSELFNACMQYSMINVNVYYRNFPAMATYQTYTQFPEFKMENRTIHSRELVFPNRLLNMHGKKLYTLLDQVIPRSTLYPSKSGQQKIGGYIGKLLSIFARKHNCTLTFPYNVTVDESIYSGDLREAIRQRNIDVAISLTTPQIDLKYHEFTYPVEITKWLTMIPLELPQPPDLLLMTVFDVKFLLCIYLIFILLSALLAVMKARMRRSLRSIRFVDLFCNDVAMRGIMGQPFDISRHILFGEKLVDFLLFVTGLFFVTSFSANLMNLLINPPSQTPVTSFADIRKQSYQILLSKNERSTIITFAGLDFWSKYKDVFELSKSYTHFLNERASLNTKYAYPIATVTWRTLNELQQHYSRKLFRLSPDLQFNNFILSSVPIYEHSFYKNILNNLILQAQSTGLIQAWHSRGFYELVLAKKLSFNDPTDPIIYNAMNVNDFYWIWIGYGFAIMFCLIGFGIEHWYYRRQSRSAFENPK